MAPLTGVFRRAAPGHFDNVFLPSLSICMIIFGTDSIQQICAGFLQKIPAECRG